MKTGRPKLQDEQKKAKITGVRLRVEEREMLEKAAAAQKQSLSDWMRDTLLQRAAAQLK